ncbi:MAG: hypothetical protein M9887_00970 [Chitinophagales bacterium]|nr:hypothetical protein [Chitinophagales bacterium]
MEDIYEDVFEKLFNLSIRTSESSDALADLTVFLEYNLDGETYPLLTQIKKELINSHQKYLKDFKLNSLETANDLDVLFEESLEDDNNQHRDRAYNKKSIEEDPRLNVRKYIRLLLSTLEYRNEGNAVLDSNGLSKNYPLNNAISILLGHLSNVPASYSNFRRSLLELAESKMADTNLKDFVDEFFPVSIQISNNEDFNKQNVLIPYGFINSFNNAKVDYVSVNFDRDGAVDILNENEFSSNRALKKEWVGNYTSFVNKIITEEGFNNLEKIRERILDDLFGGDNVIIRDTSTQEDSNNWSVIMMLRSITINRSEILPYYLDNLDFLRERMFTNYGFDNIYKALNQYKNIKNPNVKDESTKILIKLLDDYNSFLRILYNYVKSEDFTLEGLKELPFKKEEKFGRKRSAKSSTVIFANDYLDFMAKQIVKITGQEELNVTNPKNSPVHTISSYSFLTQTLAALNYEYEQKGTFDAFSNTYTENSLILNHYKTRRVQDEEYINNVSGVVSVDNNMQIHPVILETIIGINSIKNRKQLDFDEVFDAEYYVTAIIAAQKNSAYSLIQGDRANYTLLKFSPELMAQIENRSDVALGYAKDELINAVIMAKMNSKVIGNIKDTLEENISTKFLLLNKKGELDRNDKGQYKLLEAYKKAIGFEGIKFDIKGHENNDVLIKKNGEVYEKLIRDTETFFKNTKIHDGNKEVTVQTFINNSFDAFIKSEALGIEKVLYQTGIIEEFNEDTDVLKLAKGANTLFSKYFKHRMGFKQRGNKKYDYTLNKDILDKVAYLSAIANIEQMKLLYGQIGNYKSFAQFGKRFSTHTSTGKPVPIEDDSEPILAYLDVLEKQQKSAIIDSKEKTLFYSSIREKYQLKANEMKEAFIEEVPVKYKANIERMLKKWYQQEVKENLVQLHFNDDIRLGNDDLTDDREANLPYQLNMQNNIAYINLFEWRRLLMMYGEWSDRYDEIFYKELQIFNIANREKLDLQKKEQLIKKVMVSTADKPVAHIAKYIMTGSVYLDGMRNQIWNYSEGKRISKPRIMGQREAFVLPLFPSVTWDSYLHILHREMIYSGTGIMYHIESDMMGVNTNILKATDIENGIYKIPEFFISFEYKSLKRISDFTSIPKSAVFDSIQNRNNIIASKYNQSLPIDWMFSEYDKDDSQTIYQLTQKWIRYSEQERKRVSPLHKKVQDYIIYHSEIIERVRTEFLKELSIVETNNSECKYIFFNPKKAIQALYHHALKINQPNYIVDALRYMLDHDIIVLDATPNKTLIESLIMSLVRDKVIKLRRPGCEYHLDATIAFDYKYKSLYGNKGVESILFYREDEKGILKEAEIIIPTPEFLCVPLEKLLKREAVTEREKRIHLIYQTVTKEYGFNLDIKNKFHRIVLTDVLNEMIAQHLLDKEIIMRGLCIPTHGLFSNDIFKVKRFTYPTLETSIILPSEIFAKIKSGYENSRLRLYFYNIDDQLKVFKLSFEAVEDEALSVFIKQVDIRVLQNKLLDLERELLLDNPTDLFYVPRVESHEKILENFYDIKGAHHQ